MRWVHMCYSFHAHEQGLLLFLQTKDWGNTFVRSSKQGTSSCRKTSDQAKGQYQCEYKRNFLVFMNVLLLDVLCVVWHFTFAGSSIEWAHTSREVSHWTRSRHRSIRLLCFCCDVTYVMLFRTTGHLYPLQHIMDMWKQLKHFFRSKFVLKLLLNMWVVCNQVKWRIQCVAANNIALNNTERIHFTAPRSWTGTLGSTSTSASSPGRHQSEWSCAYFFMFQSWLYLCAWEKCSLLNFIICFSS